MIQRIDPLQLQITTYTINYLQDIYDKYEKIAQFEDISIRDAISKGQAHIINRNNLAFFKMFKDVDFNYELELLTIKDEIGKLVPYILDGKELFFNAEGIVIDGTLYKHDAEYNRYFDFQDDLIEYVGLAFLFNKVSSTRTRVKDLYPEKLLMDLEEASKFTGYEKKFINTALQSGNLTSERNEKGKQRFKRADLVNFMLRNECTSLTELF